MTSHLGVIKHHVLHLLLKIVTISLVGRDDTACDYKPITALSHEPNGCNSQRVHP